MGLFETIELDSKIVKSINKGLAIGIAKVDRTGKSSVQLVHRDIIIKSYKTGYTLKIPVDNIEFLNYTQGNFLEEDKIHMGISGNTLTISSNADNETELHNFYDNLIKIKNNEKTGATFLENAENFDKKDDNKMSSTTQPIGDVVKPAKEQEKVKVIKNFDPTSEIRKYYELMKDGIISQEEFDEKKKELLNYKYY